MSELGEEAEVAWRHRLAKQLDRTAPSSTQFRPTLPEASAATLSVDWTGLPGRVVSCLGRANALAFLDQGAGRAWQEEYLEWSVSRDDDGEVVRIEFTTEFADYWRVLAAFQTERTLELISRFAGRAVRGEDVYGRGGLASVAPPERELAFVETSLSQESAPALCCMAADCNSLGSLLALVNAAARPWAGGDADDLRPATAPQIVSAIGAAAALDRRSDPVLVEVLARLAYEGRLVTFDPPVCVFITGLERARLALPDGSPLTKKWFRLGRAANADAEENRGRHPRFQRLVVEAPAGTDTRVGDLIDLATEEQIRWGGQIADLVQLAVAFRVTDPATVAVDRLVIDTAAQPECESVAAAYAWALGD